MRRDDTRDTATATSRSLALLLALLIAAFLFAAIAKPPPARADPAINAVYLATDATPLDLSAVRAAGIRVVSTAAELAAAAATADAIVIDRAALATVDPAWLTEQFRQGKLIGGTNIPILELAARAGVQDRPGGLGSYLQEYGGLPFYAWFYYATEPSGVWRGGSGSDAIWSTEDFLGRLRLQIEASYARPNPTPLSPLPTRPPP